MRKFINISALLFFIFLVCDAFDVPYYVLTFLLVGEIPGTNTTLSPTTMLAIMSAASGMIIFELLARRIGVIYRTRQYMVEFLKRSERLPRRRFGRA